MRVSWEKVQLFNSLCLYKQGVCFCKRIYVDVMFSGNLIIVKAGKKKGEKMRKGKIAAIFVVLLAGTIMFSADSFAYGDTNAFGKLSRGVVNIATSPVEIFRNIYKESQYENIGYGMTVGLGKGIVQTIIRLGAGAVETMTFPLNFPDEYKDPIMEPEYVWEDWGY